MSVSKSDLPAAASALQKEDIPQLVEWLALKDDSIRYQAFLLLKYRSLSSADVYPYWDIFRNKLRSDNSYQRSIGLMLIGENANWDDENRMEDTIDEYLELLYDEKPVTIRQCIQALGSIASAKPGLNEKISSALITFDLTAVKETMRKLILQDILNVLIIVRGGYRSEEIENFILSALSGDILDKKSKKQFETALFRT
jgi:hypothetical protein